MTANPADDWYVRLYQNNLTKHEEERAMIMTDPAWQQEDDRLFESSASAPWNRRAGCQRCDGDDHDICYGVERESVPDDDYWRMLDEAMDARQQAEVRALEAQCYDTQAAWAMAENER